MCFRLQFDNWKENHLEILLKSLWTVKQLMVKQAILLWVETFQYRQIFSQISFNFFLLKLKVQTTVWKLYLILWVGTIVKVSVKQLKEMNSSFALQLTNYAWKKSYNSAQTRASKFSRLRSNKEKFRDQEKKCKIF